MPPQTNNQPHPTSGGELGEIMRKEGFPYCYPGDDGKPTHCDACRSTYASLRNVQRVNNLNLSFGELSKREKTARRVRALFAKKKSHES